MLAVKLKGGVSQVRAGGEKQAQGLPGEDDMSGGQKPACSALTTSTRVEHRAGPLRQCHVSPFHSFDLLSSYFYHKFSYKTSSEEGEVVVEIFYMVPLGYKYHRDLKPTILRLKNTSDFYQLESHIDPVFFP